MNRLHPQHLIYDPSQSLEQAAETHLLLVACLLIASEDGPWLVRPWCAELQCAPVALLTTLN